LGVERLQFDVYFLVLYKRYMFISGRQFVRFVAENNNSSHVMTPEMCLSNVHRTGASYYILPCRWSVQSNELFCCNTILCGCTVSWTHSQRHFGIGLKRCTDSTCQVTLVIEFCMVVLNIYEFSAWKLLHVTLWASRIFRWLLDDSKICTPHIWSLSSIFNNDSSYALFYFCSVTLLTFSFLIIVCLSYTLLFYNIKAYVYNDLPLGR
jgi:hypothetical protein